MHIVWQCTEQHLSFSLTERQAFNFSMATAPFSFSHIDWLFRVYTLYHNQRMYPSIKPYNNIIYFFNERFICNLIHNFSGGKQCPCKSLLDSMVHKLNNFAIENYFNTIDLRKKKWLLTEFCLQCIKRESKTWTILKDIWALSTACGDAEPNTGYRYRNNQSKINSWSMHSFPTHFDNLLYMYL